MRILVADDEADFAYTVQKCLAQGGYETKVVTSGLAALEAARAFLPHLVVLDVHMPDLSGHEVCRRLRARCAAPILMLSGMRDEGDIVYGLDVGADDYLGKPFRMAELLARVHALLRRAGGQVALVARGYRDEVLAIDPWRQRVEKRGQCVELSRNEFKLLAYLVERRGEIVPHQELLVLLSDPAEGKLVEQARVALYVSSLRKKLEDDPRHPYYLHTRFGEGYWFVADGAVDEALVPVAVAAP